jgi:hypothetical protein
MGILIQPYITPYISGVLHATTQIGSRIRQAEVAWVEGHLQQIVSGEKTGYKLQLQTDLAHSGGVVIVGQEHVVRECQRLGVINVFEGLMDISSKINDVFTADFEAEWIFDGLELWVVQVQKLTSEFDLMRNTNNQEEFSSE